MTAARLIAPALVAVALGAPATAADDLSGAGVQALESQGARDIVVRREPGLTAAERAGVRAGADVKLVRRSMLPDTEVVRASAGELSEAVAALERDRDVVYAEPVLVRHATSADAYFGLQWALENTGQWGGTPDADMDVPAAWATSTGAGVTVGIVDTGVLRTHPDLAGRLAVNSGEIDGNGVDDDHNGYVDDRHGYDFVVDDPALEVVEGDDTPGRDSDPQDDDGHGTHVAGIVAAERDNGEGIAGVAPGARIMPLRALGATGSGTSDAIADAFDYAGRLGLKIVNASLGGNGLSQTELKAIQAHPGTLYVVAAGNDGRNVDGSPVSPCALPADNILCVGATDYDDARASFSNYGTSGVDVLAPGEMILSAFTSSDDPYVFMDGTSMASPNAAGVAALLLAAAPEIDALGLKRTLMATAERKTALAGTSVTGARVNAAAAVALVLHDVDHDGHRDDQDALPNDPLEWSDADGDGTGDNRDNCRMIPNPSQADADRNGIGDACEPPPPAPPPVEPPPVIPAPVMPAPPPAVQPVRITSVHAAVTRGRRVTVRLIANQAVSVTAVASGPRRRARRAATARAHGTGTIRVRFAKRLAPGRYRIKLTAVAASDRATKMLRLKIR